MDAAQMVSDALTNNSQGPLGLTGANTPTQNYSLPSNAVNIVSVNLDNEQDRRSPSQQALDAARTQTSIVSVLEGFDQEDNPATQYNAELRAILFGYIIDCWLTYTPNSASASSTATNTGFNPNTNYFQ